MAALSLVRFHDGVNLIISQHQNYRYWVLQTLADCGLAACLVKIGCRLDLTGIIAVTVAMMRLSQSSMYLNDNA